MIRSLDTLQKSFNVLQTKQENASANAANSTTPGYKFQQVIQQAVNKQDLVTHMGGEKLNQRMGIGSMEFGNEVAGMYRHFQDGGLIQTEQPTDLALQGEGFFTIQTPQGLALTRNGQFTTNEAGILTTQTGDPVMGQTAHGNVAPIRVTSPFNVSENGHIYGTPFQFLISTPEDLQALESQGDTLFTGPVGGTMVNARLSQGYLENSNVSMADMMVELMQVSREFEANQKILHASDDTLRKTVNEVGKL